MPQQQEIRKITRLDRLRALRATPDKETLQESGPLGILKKVGASAALLPLDFVEYVKAAPVVAATALGAAQPEQFRARSQFGQMGIDAIKNTLQNPVSTAVGMAAPPALAREAAYAVLPPHVLMYLRSFMPGYAEKPWTRVPPAVKRTIRAADEAGLPPVWPLRNPYSWGVNPNMANVANKLQPYLRARNEQPLLTATHDGRGEAAVRQRLPYGLASSLEETVGSTFAEKTPNAIRILDDVRFYDTWVHDVPADSRALLNLIINNPKKALALFGGPEQGDTVVRSVLRDRLEALAAKHAHGFPVDWTIETK